MAEVVVENVPKEAMDINAAVRMVLKKSLQHDGLARGLHEGARAIEKGQVRSHAMRAARYFALFILEYYSYTMLYCCAGPAVHPG